MARHSTEQWHTIAREDPFQRDMLYGGVLWDDVRLEGDEVWGVRR